MIKYVDLFLRRKNLNTEYLSVKIMSALYISIK